MASKLATCALVGIFLILAVVFVPGWLKPLDREYRFDKQMCEWKDTAATSMLATRADELEAQQCWRLFEQKHGR
jgi:hypothetical protein